MPCTSTTTTDNILAMLFLFNILSIAVALSLYFRLVSIVKRGNAATHEIRNGTEECKMLIRSFRTMLMWKHENLESLLEDRVLPAIGRVGSECLKESLRADPKLMKRKDSSDPPTASESGDSAEDAGNDNSGWFLLTANSYSEFTSEEDISL
jgi:hypothetical protein